MRLRRFSFILCYILLVNIFCFPIIFFCKEHHTMYATLFPSVGGPKWHTHLCILLESDHHDFQFYTEAVIHCTFLHLPIVPDRFISIQSQNVQCTHAYILVYSHFQYTVLQRLNTATLLYLLLEATSVPLFPILRKFTTRKWKYPLYYSGVIHGLQSQVPLSLFFVCHTNFFWLRIGRLL
jgi:hypothetical protein